MIHPEHHGPDESLVAHPGANVNKTIIRVDANGLAIIALILAAIAFVVSISQAFYVEAKISAGIAHAEAEANEAKVTARVADDSVKSICAALKAADIKNVDCH